MIRYVLICAILMALGGAIVYYVKVVPMQRDAERGKADMANAVTVSAQAQLDALASADKLKTEGIDQHAKEQLAANDLFVALGRVRVTTPICSCAGTEAAAGSADSNGASGVATFGDDEALAVVKREMDKIGQRCAQINLDARQANLTHGFIE